MLTAVVEIAAEEIDATAEEAVKEAILRYRTETVFYQNLNESLQRDMAEYRAEQEARERWYVFGLIASGVAIGALGGLNIYQAAQ